MEIRFERPAAETRRRFETAHRELREAASLLSPEDIVSNGRWLGAGLAGGSYEVEVAGKTLVAKQLGHPESSLGGLGTWSAREKTVQAAKQVAVQNALAMAGFPYPVSVVLAPESEWVLMEKMSGQDVEHMSAEEAAEARPFTKALATQIEPIVWDTLMELRPRYPDVPKLFHCALDVDGNTFFKRDDKGLYISGGFDPVI